MSWFKRVFGFIWAAPVTIVGLIYVTLFTYVGWYVRLGTLGNAIVWRLNATRAPKWLNGMWTKWAGHCIGNVIVLKHDPNTDKGRITLRHEQEHVHQCMVLGIFQPFIYVVSYVGLSCCRYSHPYYDNPLEVDARRAAGQLIDVVGAASRAVAAGKLKPPTKTA